MIDTSTEQMIDASDKRTIDIPPAFYRDAELPPPPPDDPHWHEWWHNDNDEDDRLSRWIIYGLPLSLITVAVLHAALILVILHLNPA